MPVDLKCYRVFIASPGGLQGERAAFRKTIEDYNRSDARDRGVLFEAVGWEDTLGRAGRPQSIINEEIEDCDYFVLVLWDRWGTPPGDCEEEYESGAEEEYNLAMKCLENQKKPMRDLVLFFKAPDPRQLADPGSQLERVLNFRKKIEAERNHLHYTFEELDTFVARLRRHLARWLRIHEEGESAVSEIEGDSDPAPTAGHLPAESASDEDFRIFGKDEEAIAEAWSLANQGRNVEAEILFAKATIGGDPGAFNAYGLFLMRHRRNNRAKAMLERALEGWQAAGYSRGKACSLELLAMLHAEGGDLRAAEDLLREALELEQSEGRIHNTVTGYGNLGTVLERQGDLTGAEAMYRVALETNEARKRSEPLWEGSLYGNLGNVLLAQGELEDAREMFEKSLDVLEKIDVSEDERFGLRENLSLSYRNLGHILFRQGEFESAASMFRDAVVIDERLKRYAELAESQRYLGYALKELGDLETAEQALKAARSAAEESGNAKQIIGAVRAAGEVAFAMDKLDEAESACRRVLAVSTHSRDASGLYWAYSGLGDILEARNDQEGSAEMREAAKSLAAASMRKPDRFDISRSE